MPTLTTLAIFVPAALILLLTPGPAVLYIVARSLEQGRSAGVVSATGVALGTLVHVGAAAAGLSALLVASPAALQVVRLVGAGYLIYLGGQRLFCRPQAAGEDAPAPAPLRRIFAQGVVVNLFNPKTTLFIFAFLPQFVDPQRGSTGLQVLVLGALLVTLGLISDSCYALLAGSANRRLSGTVGQRPWGRAVSGGVLVALGVASACSGGGE